MTSPSSLVLIRRAKLGDREAWEEICRRYYGLWLERHHGRLGKGLRRLKDTEDLVQSAIKDAIQGIGKLEEEASFYCWVSTIIERKISAVVRRKHLTATVDLEEIFEPANEDEPVDARLLREEDELRLLDAMIALFQTNPVHMGLLYMRYFEGSTTRRLEEFFGIPERTIRSMLVHGRNLLRSKLWPDARVGL